MDVAPTNTQATTPAKEQTPLESLVSEKNYPVAIGFDGWTVKNNCTRGYVSGSKKVLFFWPG
jgi:hypothetical protein